MEKDIMTYQQQLKDPRWQRKRLEVMERAGFKCKLCGNDKEQFNVHHPYYRRGAMLWEYDKEELQLLCNKCHKDTHCLDERIRKALALCHEKSRILGYLLAINSQTGEQLQELPDYESCQGAVDYLFAKEPWIDDEPAVEKLDSLADQNNRRVDLWDFAETGIQREAI